MANTPTANIGLNKPAQGDAPWDATINGNMDKVDSLLSGGTSLPKLAVANGTAGAPSFAAFATPTSGIFFTPGGALDVSVVGTAIAQFQTSGLLEANNGVYGWTAGANPNAAADTAISRITGNVVGAGNGTQGDVSGTFKATNFLGGISSVTGRNGVFSGQVGGNDLFFGHGNSQYVGAIGSNNTSGLLYIDFYAYQASGVNVHNYASSSNLPFRVLVNDSGSSPAGGMIFQGAASGTVDTAITFGTILQILNNTTNPTLTFGGSTGISQTGGAGTLAIGNGTAGDASGTLKAKFLQVSTILTVATLPTCTAGLEGTFSAVSDATAPTYNAALTGSGTIHVPVYCNGTAWTSH